MPSYAFRIAGIEPNDAAWHAAPESVRREFWRAVVKFGLEAKDRELARGLDCYGRPLARIAASTRKHRKSAMGPADPNAPPLMPAYELSRTRSLLDGRANRDHAEFFWRDHEDGQHWGKILGYHRAGSARLPVRNVIGIAPVSLAWVKTQALIWWEARKKGLVITPRIPEMKVHVHNPERPGDRARPPKPIKVTGETDLRYFTFGIGAGKTQVERAQAAGYFSGFSQLTMPQTGPRARRIVPPRPPRPPKSPVSLAPTAPQFTPKAPAPLAPQSKRRGAGSPAPSPATEPTPKASTTTDIDRRIAADTDAKSRVEALQRYYGRYQEAVEAQEAQRTVVDQAEAAYKQAARGKAKAAAKAQWAAEVEKFSELGISKVHAGQRARGQSFAALGVEDAVTTTAGGLGLVDNITSNSAEAAIGWLNKVVAKRDGMTEVHAPIRPIPHTEEQRSYCEPGGISLERNCSGGMAVHEFGHYLDFNAPGFNKASQEFLKYRCGDEPSQPLRKVMGGHYDRSEKGRKDKFDAAFGDSAWYVGKEYEDTESSEITSMGIQKLYEDPTGFAVKDPEYCQFIIGLLRGTLRSSTAP